MILLSPSLLAADFAVLGEQIRKLEQAGANYIHVDVMDGIFVPSISFGMPVLKSIRKFTDMVLDVHLMIMDPERYIEDFRNCGADIITFHIESCDTPTAMIDMIHAMGMKAGITVRPETAIELLYPHLHEVEMALVMSVSPGFGGQHYLPGATERIQKIRKFVNSHALGTDVQVDGGITHENVAEVVRAGANVIVAGSAVFRGDIAENVREFEDIFEKLERGGK